MDGGRRFLRRGRPGHRRPRHVLVRVARRAVLAGLAVTVPAAAAGVAYVASIDLPPEPKAPQASVLYYRDGVTVLARLGVTDRTDVPLSSVPVPVRHAFLAAEDRGFYGHFGVSAKGVLRAVVSNLTRDTGEGASTITQQYVRNAYLTQQRTVQRKLQEAALSIKLEQRLSKDQILQRYLNTIYFGRGAYGIQSAAQAYFGTTVDKLTASQGAVLAALVKDPYLNDPAHDPDRARDRWHWILAAMADLGWYPRDAAAHDRYPGVAQRSVTAAAVGGPLGVIADRVQDELHHIGVSPQTVQTAGLHVVTTIDAGTQRAAMTAVTDTLRGQPKSLHTALVAVDPATGAVRAYFGGTQGSGFFDDAIAPRPPASTFKPIVLAAGAAKGFTATSLWDGTSPRLFRDRQGVPLHNKDDLQCPVCPLVTAMVYSLNTPFYSMAEHLGPDFVRDMAVRLGIPQRYGKQKTMVDLKGEPAPGRTRGDIALGRYPVSPADLAGVYAAFASGGIGTTRYLVERVTGGGRSWRLPPHRRERVLDAAVAGDVSYALSEVVRKDGALPERPAAAKTGSQQWQDTLDSSDAWTAGYTPQLAAAVWIGRSTPGPIRDARGRPINGDGMPYTLWRRFVTRALAGEPAAPLPPRVGPPRVSIGDAFPKATPVGLVFTPDKRIVDRPPDVVAR
jgi:membrane peptidoglycan carboxypeptidase